MARSTKKSRIYAAVKGCIDAGLKIPCDDKMMPNEKDLKTKMENFEEIKKKIEQDYGSNKKETKIKKEKE